MPPAPEDFGPRRLAKYRREYVAAAKGEAPSLDTQGVPVVPALEPDDRVLELQRRFAALAAQGSIDTLSEDEEFLAFVDEDATPVSYGQNAVLDQVRDQILGGSALDESVTVGSVNPSHLFGLTHTDLRPTDYDENLLGPVTVAVPVLGQAVPEQDPVVEAVPTSEAPEESVPRESLSEEPVPEAAEEKPAAEERDQEDAPHAPAQDEVPARPLRAVDAHGLDLSGLDEKGPRSGGRTGLFLLLLLVLAALVVLGLVILL